MCDCTRAGCQHGGEGTAIHSVGGRVELGQPARHLTRGTAWRTNLTLYPNDRAFPAGGVPSPATTTASLGGRDLEAMLNQLEEESLQKAAREMPERHAALAESVRALRAWQVESTHPVVSVVAR